MKKRIDHLGNSTLPVQNLASLVESFMQVAPLFFADKGRCIVVLSPQSKKPFDQWISMHRDAFLKNDNNDYDGYATLEDGYFAIRLRDDQHIVQKILTEIGVYESGQYLVAHKPTKQARLQKQQDASAPTIIPP